jgi:hypothetical protein
MRYETVENKKPLILENAHLALNYVTLTGVDDDRRKTVIYGGGEAKKRGVIIGRYSTVKNLTISNGWAEAKGGRILRILQCYAWFIDERGCFKLCCHLLLCGWKLGWWERRLWGGCF